MAISPDSHVYVIAYQSRPTENPGLYSYYNTDTGTYTARTMALRDERKLSEAVCLSDPITLWITSLSSW